MTDIIPAILPESYKELEEKLEIVSGTSPVVQIDICDGGFVPSRTWPYLKHNHDDVIFESILSQEKAFPCWEDIDFEFDLMIRNADEKIPDFITAGASRIVVHMESLSQKKLTSVIDQYGKHDDASETFGAFDIELGIAVSNTITPEQIASFVDKVHFIQVMGINKIGYQGESFEPRTVSCVKALRDAYPELIITVDGGVNLESARLLIDAGVDSLVVGSGVFGTETVLENIQSFTALS